VKGSGEVGSNITNIIVINNPFFSFGYEKSAWNDVE